MDIEGGLSKEHSIGWIQEPNLVDKKSSVWMKSNNSPRVEGITMFYLSYTKITIFIQIIRFKLMYGCGPGFGGFRFF